MGSVAASLLLWESCTTSLSTVERVVFTGCTSNVQRSAANFSCATETSCDASACRLVDCTCSRCVRMDAPEAELSCACSAGGCACAEQQTESPHLTVSGQSAGGSMAIQHLVAYSHSVDGAAIVAGSPYGCGAVPLDQWICFTGPFGTLDEDRALRYIRERRESGLIDAPVWLRLRRTPLLLFSGSKDHVVWQDVMRATARQLEALAAPGQVASVFNTSASHVWSIDHGDCSCGDCALELGDGVCCDVNNCLYDLSGDMLSRFYGPALRQRSTPLPRLHWVAQWPFVPAHAARLPTPARMLEWAIVYVSSGCEREPSRCRLHVNYHGCTANDWKQRREWVRHIDLNEYAESNDLVVVYPQAAGNNATGTGCWDWFDAGDADFDTRRGSQLSTVTALIADIDAAVRGALVLPDDALPPNEAGGAAAHEAVVEAADAN